MSKSHGLSRRKFNMVSAALGLAAAPMQSQPSGVEPVLPGIWRLRFGAHEVLTPVTARRYQPAREALAKLTNVSSPPLRLNSIVGSATNRGFAVSLPLEPNEMVYGLGLQFYSFLQRGLKKKLRVNADPSADLGDSHAPVPFYVSARGYGVLIDTARYVNIYCGNKAKKGASRSSRAATPSQSAAISAVPESYKRYHLDQHSQVLVEVPDSRGVDIYLFAGPTMREAVQRYNLFSGGGPLPPRWGLGFWYRCYGSFGQDEVLGLADQLRREKIPCDVLGLEPGWQSHSYSCSFVWSDKFPDPTGMISRLNESGYKVNLWEHAFTHPTSPLHSALVPYSGDYEVWDGLTPDFAGEQARKIFGDYHQRTLIEHGVSGFKLDECDNSDYTGNWSWPELSQFPSGADGEQMHSFFGLRYQDTIQTAFERTGTRTLGLVRSSHALASPYPYALYSDTYDHKQFIRALLNAGFSGLLWCPEVRDARDPEDLIRRLQTVIFSPVAMVNAWYIKNPPWKQVDKDANNSNRFAPGWEELEATCRELISLRMQFVPYLYAAFVRYRLQGIPPFRALVMDYPDDPRTWTVDDQYLVGEDLLAAPVVAGEHEREIYLPRGEWIDFWTRSTHRGETKLKINAPLNQIPLFIKKGSLLPLAQSTLSTRDPHAFKLTVRKYGSGARPCTLYEDDGSLEPAFTRLTIKWDDNQAAGVLARSGPRTGTAYTVETWESIT
ncbi:MAG: glycoside hydrolase [Acidobacteriota bacterium]|nr:glycoside hydrolase [Acidobacteriota bacterium]